MPALSEAEGAQVESEHRAWVYSLPTQAHVRASDPAVAASLAAEEAAALAEQSQPRLAKLKCDLLRVQAALPPPAMAESWDADAWRQVRAIPLACFVCCQFPKSLQRKIAAPGQKFQGQTGDGQCNLRVTLQQLHTFSTTLLS